jgi:hypothetical protein
LIPTKKSFKDNAHGLSINLVEATLCPVQELDKIDTSGFAGCLSPVAQDALLRSFSLPPRQRNSFPEFGRQQAASGLSC